MRWYFIFWIIVNTAKYKGQSNENRTPATKWQWNLFYWYSKVIARSVNTFIPLGDNTINSSLVERGRSLMDPQPLPLLLFIIRMKPTFTNVFLQIAKNVEVTRGKIWDVGRICPGMCNTSCKWRINFSSSTSSFFYYSSSWSVSQPNLWSLSLIRLAVWGWALSCRRMILSNNIPKHFDCRVLQHPWPPRNQPHLSGLLCLPPFPLLDEHTLHYTHLQSIKKQLCGPVRFHYTCLLPYRWQYRYVTTVLPAFARNVFYGRCLVFIWLPLIS